jgi:abortive infection bacteriophage resistance protein
MEAKFIKQGNALAERLKGYGHSSCPFCGIEPSLLIDSVRSELAHLLEEVESEIRDDLSVSLGANVQEYKFVEGYNKRGAEHRKALTQLRKKYLGD